jgi:hypothetical protein
MASLKNNQRGFSPVEGVLIVLVVVAIAFVGWYVYKNHKSTPLATSTADHTVSGSPSSSLSSGSSNADLSNDLNTINGSSSQNNQDLTNVNNSLNDQSTMTSVPN